MKFELVELQSLDQMINTLKSQVTQELVSGQVVPSRLERSDFLEVVMSEPSAFLGFQKFQLTSLILHGFDAHIGPFNAIIDILSRLTGLSQALSALPDDIEDVLADNKPQKLQCIKKGYAFLQIYTISHLIELNSYMLAEYLRHAAKAIDRRNKDILQTGCIALLESLVPALSRKKLVEHLILLAEANYEMWVFHPGFDYYYFYSKLPVEDGFINVFKTNKAVAVKCRNTGTLTPFMLGITRNYDSFIRFAETVPSAHWLSHLKILIDGLLLTIKVGTFKFREVIQLLDAAVQACSFYSGQAFVFFLNKLDEPVHQSWNEIDSFFRSALKSGYSCGIYPAFNKIDNDEITKYIQNIIFEGVVTMTRITDEGLKQKWLEKLNQVSTKEEQVSRFKEYLVKGIQEFDPSYVYGGLLTEVQTDFKAKADSIRELSIRKSLRKINNAILALEGYGQDLLHNNSFQRYLATFVLKLSSPACEEQVRQIASAIICKATRPDVAGMMMPEPIIRLATSLNTGNSGDMVDQAFFSRLSTFTGNECISHLRQLWETNNGKMPAGYLNRILNYFFANIVDLNKQYIISGLNKMSIEEGQKFISSTLGRFFSSSELSLLLKRNYVLNNNNLKFTGSLSEADNYVNLKSFQRNFRIDQAVQQLDTRSSDFLGALISQYIVEAQTHSSGKQPAEKADESFSSILLRRIVTLFPVVGYFVLNYSTATKEAVSSLDSTLSEFSQFSSILWRMALFNRHSFELLVTLMENRVIRSSRAEGSVSIIQNLTNINILDNIVKQLKQKYVKSNPSSQETDKILSIIELLGKLIHKTSLVNPDSQSGGRLESLVEYCLFILKRITPKIANQYTPQILKAYDQYVNLIQNDQNTHSLNIYIARENARYSPKQQQQQELVVQAPSLEINVFREQPEKLKKPKTAVSPSQPIQFEKCQIQWAQADWEKLGLKKVNQPPTSIKPTKDTTVVTSPSKQSKSSGPLTQDPILNQLLLQQQKFMADESDSTTGPKLQHYVFPQLTFSQVGSLLLNHLTTQQQQPLKVLYLALRNKKNCFNLTLQVTALLVEGNQCASLLGADGTKVNFNDEVVISGLLEVLLKLSFTRTLSLKPADLPNSAQLCGIKAHLSKRKGSLVNQILFKILCLKNPLPQSFFIQWIASLLSSNINPQSLLYDVSLEPEIINLIQMRLPATAPLSFLIHCNPENLRSYLNSLAEGMSKLNLASKVLTYHQLVKLTSNPGSDEEFMRIFVVFRDNWAFYTEVVEQRLLVLETENRRSLYFKHLKDRKSMDEQLIRKEFESENTANKLSFLPGLNQICSQANIREFLRRHSDLVRTLVELKVEAKQLIDTLVSIVPVLKKLCLLFRNIPVLPDFAYHHRYNSDLLVNQDIGLPNFIELWEETVPESIASTISQDKGQIRAEKRIQVEYEKLDRINPRLSQPVTVYTILREGKPLDEKKAIELEINKLLNQKILEKKSNIMSISPKAQKSEQGLKTLGFLIGNYVLKTNKKQPLPVKFDVQLSSYLSRKRLDWKLAGPAVQNEINKVLSHASVTLIIQISINPIIFNQTQVKELDLTFSQIRDGQLIEFTKRGSERKVTDLNKVEYCNFLAIKGMASRTLAQALLDGVCSVIDTQINI